MKLTVPRFLGKDVTFETDLRRNQRNLERWSSYVEQRTGFSAGLLWYASIPTFVVVPGFADI